ncbi:carbon-nitrogen hydrolase family protein [Enterovirga rhinocerotis]|uniref:Putative amidohydrolase n=1 Tax=Enterovirga rhinocerotis TaxID=1339210 RepID=A0A4R7CC53_9HYPH|nr:carbon-nitrogen hydrolase family protein [Enterovirga rhinocerotis]TDR95035.1 putative amidohydrolase [Enterovirga rhinocerotis]
MTRPFKAACVTMRSGRDPAANLDAATRMIHEAAAAGASFVQTPEITNLCDRNRPAVLEKTTTEDRDATLAGLRETARELAITLHIGSLALRSSGDRLANRGFLVGPDGEILRRYDKIHLFDVDLPNGESWRESNSYDGGSEAALVETPLGRIGMTICYDVRFAGLYRALAEAGAEILTAPACFTRQTGEAHWQVLQRARAIETGSFMISAAQAGEHEDGRETYGHSIIVDPWGRVLAEGGAEPGLVMAEIDLALVADSRARIPTLKNGRPFRVATTAAARPLAAAG